MTKHDEPINPVGAHENHFGKHVQETYGLTKREYFSGLALQSQIALLQNTDAMRALKELSEENNDTVDMIIARKAIEHADALIAALNGK